MSRIGKKPVAIPSGVKVELTNGTIHVKGAKGSLSTDIPHGITTKVDKGQIVFERESDEKSIRALHGLTRALVSNMVSGVAQGFARSLDIVGVGYKAELAGKNAVKFTLGYSKPIDFPLPEGVTAVVEERGTRIIIQGIDKGVVGETAAKIKRLRLPDSYKGKGIKYTGEMPKLKAGKAGTKK